MVATQSFCFFFKSAGLPSSVFVVAAEMRSTEFTHSLLYASLGFYGSTENNFLLSPQYCCPHCSWFSAIAACCSSSQHPILSRTVWFHPVSISTISLLIFLLFQYTEHILSFTSPLSRSQEFLRTSNPQKVAYSYHLTDILSLPLASYFFKKVKQQCGLAKLPIGI